MLGFEFRIKGSGFRVQGSGFRVQGSGFRVQGAGRARPLCPKMGEVSAGVLFCQWLSAGVLFLPVAMVEVSTSVGAALGKGATALTVKLRV